MQRWVVLGVVVLLVFSSFGFVFAQESFQEVKDLQVKAEKCESCSCQDFNIDKALSEVNEKIENLAKVINQKEVELRKLYAELNRAKSVETLERIVKLEDGVQLLKSEREFYKRRKNDLELLRKYTIKTAFGVRILYFKLPKEDEIIKKHVEESGISREIVGINDLTSFYWDISGDIFNKIVQTDLKLRAKLGTQNETVIEDALRLINEKRRLWNNIYRYLEMRDELYTFQYLREVGKRQVILNTFMPLALQTPSCVWDGDSYVCSQINSGVEMSNYCCLDYYGFKEINYPSFNYRTFRDITPAVVWIGLYNSKIQDESTHFADWCTYEFPPDNDGRGTLVEMYWDTAKQIGKDLGEPLGSIQIKFFYTAEGDFPTGEWWETNLIYQYDCYLDSQGIPGCWPSTGHDPLFSTPQDPPYYVTTKIYIYPYVLPCRCGPDFGCVPSGTYYLVKASSFRAGM